MTASAKAPAGGGPRALPQFAASRIVGLDVARCVAIFGMVIVNYKNALRAYGGAPAWITKPFDCVDGRAAVTFVTLAGMGAILLSRDARTSGDPDRRWAARKRLFYRAMFILVMGIANFQVWPGDILHFYGLYMATGALMLYAKPGRLLVFAACAVAAMYALPVFFPSSAGYGPAGIWYIDYLTPRGFLRNEFVNGVHPYFPWVAYYLFGMWLAQRGISDRGRRWRILAIAIAGIALCEAAQSMWFREGPRIGVPSAPSTPHFLLSYVPDLLRMGSLESSAVTVIMLSLAITELRPGSRSIAALAVTGKMALTHYLGHTTLVLGPLFIWDQLEQNHSRWSSLGLALAYCVAAVTFSNLWQKRYRFGPLEAIMRRICG